ncbi:MAG: hypothetical protein LKH08_04565 [Atopobiaceae bacterium]|nr:hypothetical protein [Atopobiaceae bacterium]MCH4119060.1 hypothetical protein [Atopobiaceae bacterium]MCI1389784.1 hypothetical protein [Atopobiaceae bacterium]MCI1432181.1 hypothetical protein [Atopobiaceae bacterium]MCI1470639.1 hypothetical protein [Atopobiaceae bacterium]
MKAIEQFPEVASIALGLAKEHREGIQAGIDANERSAKDATASIDAVIETFAVELSRDDLGPEKRLQIVKTLDDLPALKVEMHKEDQAFILRAPSILGGSSSRPVPAP